MHSRLEAADNVDDVDKLDGILVEQQGLVRYRGVFPLRHCRQSLYGHDFAENILRTVPFRTTKNTQYEHEHDGVVCARVLSKSATTVEMPTGREDMYRERLPSVTSCHAKHAVSA